MELSKESIPSPGFLIKLTLISWFSMIGFDFFLHAGLLPSLYSQPHPFLLPPAKAFALIPVGYLSFLIIDIFLIWLMVQLNKQGLKKGLYFGFLVGLFTWGSFTLGLYSITTAPPVLLVAWFFGQIIEISIAGGIIGFGLTQTRLRRLFIQVSIVVIIFILLSILLQNIGFA